MFGYGCAPGVQRAARVYCAAGCAGVIAAELWSSVGSLPQTDVSSGSWSVSLVVAVWSGWHGVFGLVTITEAGFSRSRRTRASMLGLHDRCAPAELAKIGMTLVCCRSSDSQVMKGAEHRCRDRDHDVLTTQTPARDGAFPEELQASKTTNTMISYEDF